MKDREAFKIIRAAVLEAVKLERDKRDFNLFCRGHEARLTLDRQLAGILKGLDIPRAFISGYGANYHYPVRVFKTAQKLLNKKLKNNPFEICDGYLHDVKLRTVIIIIPDWPSGTMSIKFGSSLFASLDVPKNKIELLQMAPDRIFRVETRISEFDFRKEMNTRNMASIANVLFIDNPEITRTYWPSENRS